MPEIPQNNKFNILIKKNTTTDNSFAISIKTGTCQLCGNGPMIIQYIQNIPHRYGFDNLWICRDCLYSMD